MTALDDAKPFQITDDRITWANKFVVIDVGPHQRARHVARIVDADQWTVLATWRPGGLPDLLSHGIFERATGYGREIRGARLYNMALASDADNIIRRLNKAANCKRANYQDWWLDNDEIDFADVLSDAAELIARGTVKP